MEMNLKFSSAVLLSPIPEQRSNSISRFMHIIRNILIPVSTYHIFLLNQILDFMKEQKLVQGHQVISVAADINCPFSFFNS